MLPKRVIPCLDVDDGRVVKGTNFADMQDVGDPVALARRYEAEGADELVFLDISATAEQRSTMVDTARRVASEVFIPFTVGGGIRNQTDAQRLLDAGADKVAVNSAALARPELLGELAGRLGRQCVTLAIDAKSNTQGSWEAYAAAGKIPTGSDAISWAEEAVRRGVGEILLTSIDRDGTNSGYDLDLIRAVSRTASIPVIASGGAGEARHYAEAIRDAGAEAVLAASQFHNGQNSIGEVKSYLATKLGEASVRPSQVTELPGSRYKSEAQDPRIAIVDYGIGNRYSVEQALRFVGADVCLTDDAAELEAVDGIVLPGVGAFGPAMESLSERGLDVALRRLARLGKPLLGICLGEQLLFSGSEEGGWHGGLNLIPGEVREINSEIRPNIGWRKVGYGNLSNGLLLSSGLAWAGNHGYEADKDMGLGYFYHLHQYAAQPDDLSRYVAGWTKLKDDRGPGEIIYDWQAASIVASSGRQHVYGVQFHPEKSSGTGLKLLRGFVAIAQEYKRRTGAQK